MSMQLSIHCGPAQEKPTVDVRESDGYYWLDIRYDPTIQSAGMIIHGRSRAQCERLAAAWLGMWDEPANLDDVGEKLKAAGFGPEVYEPMQPAEIVPAAEAFTLTNTGPDRFSLTIHPEDGQPLDEAPAPHHYHPSTMHMGDCSVCGNLEDHPNHISPRKTNV